MPEEFRPILNLPTTPIERIYDGISTGVVLALVLLALWSFLNLPDTIPIHWNFKGEADGFGSRYSIAFIPVLSIIYALVNQKMISIPHKYNYLKTITEENAGSEYLKARKLLRIVHLVVQVVFALIVYSTIRGTVTSDYDLNMGVIPIALALTLAPVIHAFYSNRKNPKII